MNLKVVTHTPTRDCIAKGFNHIPSKPWNIEECSNEIYYLFYELIEDGFIVPKSKEIILTFRNFINKELATLFKRSLDKPKSYAYRFANIKQDFYICQTDKAPNNPTFVCKYLIKSLAKTRLGGPDFEIITNDYQEITSKLNHEIVSLTKGYDLHHHATLPFLMATFKAHKDDFRWITNAHNCVYSNIAAVLTSILKTCIEPLQIFMHAAQ